jgi:hypothetical protein
MSVFNQWDGSKQPEKEKLSGIERLGLRVSGMINSPVSQMERRVLIHRLDSDEDEAWDTIIGILAETEGLGTTRYDEKCVMLWWDFEEMESRIVGVEELRTVDLEASF